MKVGYRMSLESTLKFQQEVCPDLDINSMEFLHKVVEEINKEKERHGIQQP